MRILVDMPTSFGIAESNVDLLYFDADLQIGDTLESLFYPTWFNDENVRLRITAIDTILIGNEYRVVWTTEDLYSMVEVDVFTSGIGNSSGLFNFGFPPMLDSYTTYNTCYTDPNGQNLRFHEMYGPLYENYIFNSCFQGTFGGTETILNNSLSVFPNPGNDFLRLETELNLSGTIYMYDISGRMVDSQPVSNSNNIVNTAQLESGVYILMFIDQAGNRSTGKWIKE
jgi:hypothetical protein